MYVSAHKTNADFKKKKKKKKIIIIIINIKSTFNAPTSADPGGFPRVRINHITVHTLRIRTDRPEQKV